MRTEIAWNRFELIAWVCRMENTAPITSHECKCMCALWLCVYVHSKCIQTYHQRSRHRHRRDPAATEENIVIFTWKKLCCCLTPSCSLLSVFRSVSSKGWKTQSSLTSTGDLVVHRQDHKALPPGWAWPDLAERVFHKVNRTDM